MQNESETDNRKAMIKVSFDDFSAPTASRISAVDFQKFFNRNRSDQKIDDRLIDFLICNYF